jgi:MFS family permease
MMFFAYISVFIVVAGMTLLLPEMLADESFGLTGKNREETLGNISKAFGLIAIPQGICNIFVSLVFFVPVTKRLGDIKTIVVAGTIASLNFAAYGLWATKLWQLCINQAITGVCFGLMVPALSPLMARYSSVHYPSQAAECQAIPVLGMNLAMTFGQNILAMMLTHYGMKPAWILCGSCCIVFVLLLAACCRLVDVRTPQSETLTAEQRKVMLQIGGEDVDKFIDAACEELRYILAQNKENLWNRPVQFLVRQGLGAAMPQIREWNDLTHGQEYLDDLATLLHAFPEESAGFHSKFPQAGARRRSQLGAVDLDVEGGVLALPNLTRNVSTNKVAQADASPRTLGQSPKNFVSV